MYYNNLYRALDLDLFIVRYIVLSRNWTGAFPLIRGKEQMGLNGGISSYCADLWLPLGPLDQALAGKVRYG